MSESPPSMSELARLIGRLADECLTEADATRLAEILRDDADARAFYLDHVELHAGLQWELAPAEDSNKAAELKDGVTVCELPPGWEGDFAADLPAAADVEAGDREPTTGEVSMGTSRSSGLVSVLGIPSAWLPSNGVLFLYLVAALVLSGGLTVTWAWRMPASIQLAGNTPSPAGLKQAELKPIVGKILQTAQCRCSNENRTVKIGDPVRLGDRYALLSGVLEIAYVAGPTVRVEGPAQFEIDSPTSGFLRVGKLNVTMGTGCRDGTSSRAFFAIHTPEPLGTRRTVRTKDVDFTALVTPTRDLQVIPQTPATLDASLNSVQSLAMHPMPAVPGRPVAGHYNPEQELCLTFVAKEVPPGVAGKSQQRNSLIGGAGRPKEGAAAPGDNKPQQDRKPAAAPG